MKIFILFIILVFQNIICYSQNNFPWERPLNIATSNDGQFFSSSSIFQDSSGVPSAIHWKGDTLVCVFQWFRQPINSMTWDKVAVKFSYDKGLSWTQPTPLVFTSMPNNYQRPFDPTLVIINNDSLRIFFSSSAGMPGMNGDSIIDTYSAVSIDGIHFDFEPGARFGQPLKKVIDPACIIYKGTWHYTAPIGAPQDGAYHCTSNNGINFIRHADIPSDPMHNWTGNFLIEDTTLLKFYGAGQKIWYNSSPDGFTWNGYVNTNVTGGDPTIVRTDSNNYMLIYVGAPYLTSVEETERSLNFIYPNPVNDKLFIKTFTEIRFEIYSNDGKFILSGAANSIDVSDFPPGLYYIRIYSGKMVNQYLFTRQ